MPIISALKREEYHECKASPGYSNTLFQDSKKQLNQIYKRCPSGVSGQMSGRKLKMSLEVTESLTGRAIIT